MAAENKSLLYCSKSNKHSTERLFDLIRGIGEEVTVQTLLQEGVDIEARDSKGYTPLLIACFYCQKKTAELLIKSGANVDCCNSDEWTVLHYASRNGWTRMVRSLVKKVPNVNARDIRGDAAQHSRKKVVDELLNYKANVDGNEGLLFYYASRNKWVETAEYLVNRVPRLNKRYATPGTALNAVSNRRYLEIVKCLVEEETDINIRMICQAVLHDASRMGHLEVVKWLVKKGLDMKRVPRNKYGWTALHTALIRGHLDVVKYLVEEGTDIDARDEEGETALHKASREGPPEIVKYLLEKGADVNISDELGKTALHKASRNGHLEIVKCLVEQGADINVKDCCGLTPLLCATEHSKKDVVDLLMNSGANVHVSNRRKATVLHFAAGYGWIDIVQSLVKGGYDLDARDILGMTALGAACFTEEFPTIQYLLKAEASWDITDNDGSSPLNYLTSQERPQLELIKLFIENGAYLKPIDFDAIIKNSSLEVLQDVQLCCQSIANKFNNHDLHELYKLPASRILPRIEEMKIASGSEIAQAIEQIVKFEIRTKGHCNILDVCPMTLNMFSVNSLLEQNENIT